MMLSTLKPFVAGVLVANSAPHLASAAAGKEHLTPLAGRTSGPLMNALWAVMNLAGGAALLATGRRTGGGSRRRWGDDLVAFEAGYLAFAGWMAGSERLTAVNHGR